MDLEKIVAQAKKGEREAQSALYQQYFQKIYSLALGITENPEDTMDICQETFLSAFQQLSSLRESAAFPHWLCQIAANQCRRLVKNKGRFLSPEQKEDEPDFFSSLPDDDPKTLPSPGWTPWDKIPIYRKWTPPGGTPRTLPTFLLCRIFPISATCTAPLGTMWI